MTERERLKQIIIELSYEKRKVTLASGRESDFYFDGKQTTLHAEGGFLVGRLFYEAIRDVAGVEAVGGITLGADPIATATSIAPTWTGEGSMPSSSGKSPRGTAPDSGWRDGRISPPVRRWSSSRMSSPPAALP